LRRFLAYASLLSLAACANSSGPGCVQVQNASLPVTFTAQGLPVVDVVVAGQTLHMLVDTGAEVTVIAQAAAKKIPSSFIDGGIIRMEGANGGLDSQARSARLMRLGGISVKDEEIVCCERGSSKFGAPRGFIEDGGRPPEVGLQGQISNHHKLQG
jgi:predicted aspartyl protease